MNPRPGPGAIFAVFLKLGCSSFGGPVAHLGFFEEELVRKRRWIDAGAYAGLVALCQFLPGPASSQVAFAFGVRLWGVVGGFLAWAAFTLPSAALMLGLALAYNAGSAWEVGSGWLVGLKLAAAAVVADAIFHMASRLCNGRIRAAIAVLAATVLIVVPGAFVQVLVIALGGTAGWVFLRREPQEQSLQAEEPMQCAGSLRRGRIFLGLFTVLLVGLPFATGYSSEWWLRVGAGFYRAGALVFGGGHVVLPLLDRVVVGSGWVDSGTFLAGYGAAQALPGPLFAVSAFYGAVGFGLPGGVLALLAISLPSWLLVLGVLPFWEHLHGAQGARAALAGANAAVVGLLTSAFYNPISTSTLTSPAHVVFAVLAFLALRGAHVPPWMLVGACGVAGALIF